MQHRENWKRLEEALAANGRPHKQNTLKINNNDNRLFYKKIITYKIK